MSAGAVGTGTVVGVLADSLLKESGRKDYRDAILDGRMCLMSEVHPEAKFDVGNAMARNRLAYACADSALIVECDPDKGGTWAGALDALKEGKAVYVVQGAKAERELVERGAIRIPLDFALNPQALIQGQRPVLPVPEIPKLLAAVREVLGNPVYAREELVNRFRNWPEEMVEKLLNAALQDGAVEPARSPEIGKPSSEPKKHSKKKAPAQNLFDAETASLTESVR
jgi:predicted Rossmann fold nucleotide-binding protein DprA/Smf involved in DNA uptake